MCPHEYGGGGCKTQIGMQGRREGAGGKLPWGIKVQGDSQHQILQDVGGLERKTTNTLPK